MHSAPGSPTSTPDLVCLVPGDDVSISSESQSGREGVPFVPSLHEAAGNDETCSPIGRRSPQKKSPDVRARVSGCFAIVAALALATVSACILLWVWMGRWTALSAEKPARNGAAGGGSGDPRSSRLQDLPTPAAPPPAPPARSGTGEARRGKGRQHRPRDATPCVDLAEETHCARSTQCCPGGPGAAHCGHQDCRPMRDRRTYFCIGKWMSANCARTCGLCDPCETVVEDNCTGLEACCPGGPGAPYCEPQDCVFNTTTGRYRCLGKRMIKHCFHTCGLCDPCRKRDARSEANCKGSEACCPGGVGSPFCASSDCTLNEDRRTRTCPGTYMKQNCAHTCGLCGPSDLLAQQRRKEL